MNTKLKTVVASGSDGRGLRVGEGHIGRCNSTDCVLAPKSDDEIVDIYFII